MPERRHLLDVNVLVALTAEDHVHHELVSRWFDAPGLQWGVCPFTEAGFLRVTTNPKIGMHTMEEATEVLVALAEHPGFSFWPIGTGWTTLTAPFRRRIFGHQQVTDAYLLGLAIQADGILVTMDKAIQYLAGAQFSDNLLILG